MKPINFTPLGDRVVVRPVDKPSEVKTETGLVLAQSQTKMLPSEGIVVAVGPGYMDSRLCVATGETFIPLTVKIGDRVMFGSRIAGFNIEVDGEKYLLLHENDIAGIIRANDSSEAHS